MTNKQQMKQKVQKILIQIHRGFLTKEQSDTLSDKEILENVPENKGTFIRNPDDSQEARITPFTYKWVKKQLKKNPDLTAYDMLVKAGFKEQANEL